MPDVVHCHSCENDWFRNEWGLICPYCECEITEIVVVDHQFNAIQDASFVAGIADDIYPPEIPIWDGVVQEAEVEPAEVIIAVMGVTGSGKSTFIRTMTRDGDVHVGHTLESATSEVNSYQFTHKGINFVLVDTPGFNDTTYSDEVIMNRVLEWLESSYRSGMRLNGLIYLHRIIDPKMQGSALSNIRMFRKLCGPGCFPNIVLATTFWGDVTPDLGAERERQLKENKEFWGDMVKKGSQVVRLGTDRDTGLKVLMEIAKKQKITLQSQHEMVTENKAAGDTTVAQELNAEILQQKKEFERLIEEKRLESQRQLEQQKIAKQEALEKERRLAKERERVLAAEAAERKAKEERALKAKYERQQKEIREEKKRVERERKEQEAREEKEKQDLIAAQRQMEEELAAERKRYYEDYTCQRSKLNRIWCDVCYTDIKDASYWHCCHCDGDNHDECDDCSGSGTYRSCGVAEHPWMERRYHRADDDCVVM